MAPRGQLEKQKRKNVTEFKNKDVQKEESLYSGFTLIPEEQFDIKEAKQDFLRSSVPKHAQEKTVTGFFTNIWKRKEKPVPIVNDDTSKNLLYASDDEKTDEEEEQEEKKDAQAQNVQVEEKPKSAWDDLTDEERITSSVRESEKISAEINSAVKQDIKKEGFQNYHDITKRYLRLIRKMSNVNGDDDLNEDVGDEKLEKKEEKIVGNPKEAAAKKKEKRDKARIDAEKAAVEVAEFLSKLKEDLTKLNDAWNTAKLQMKEKHAEQVNWDDKVETSAVYQEALDKFNAEYQGISKKELQLLWSYAPWVLFEQKGSLEAPDDPECIHVFEDKEFVNDQFVKLEEGREKKRVDGVDCTKQRVVMGEKSDRTKTPLFSREPSTFDIKQGNLGDCYFLSALNAVLEKDPSLITGAMKDEGKTVLVRFFDKEKKPLYVRVNKTVPVMEYQGKENGKDVIKTDKFGAKGAFWVCMMEKAFAAGRQYLEEGSTGGRVDSAGLMGYQSISGGKRADCVLYLTGKKAEQKELGWYKNRTQTDKDGKKIDSGQTEYRFWDTVTVQSTEIKKIEEPVKLSEEEEQEQDVKKKGRTLHNKKVAARADKIFGRKSKNKDDKISSYFFSKRIQFNAMSEWNKYLEKLFYENYESCNIKDGNWETSKASIRTSEELWLFLMNVDVTKMPDILPDELKDKKLNEEQQKTMNEIKAKYIEFFYRSATTNLLKSSANMTGDYTDDERAVFNEIKEATEGVKKEITVGKGANKISVTRIEKKAVTAGITRYKLERKEQSKTDGLYGEKMIAGLAAHHAYSVVGVKEEDGSVNGKQVKHLFILVANPWGSAKIRRYDEKRGTAYGKTEKTDDNGDTYDPHGIFKVELSDFITSFTDYSVT